MDLPRHLSPWATQLAIFPREMALALGATVSRLSNLIGSWQPAQATEGEPDGYNGIARRGTYDRLLPAEWLMLEEVPEEFLRRVIAGEHAFLQRAHTSRAAGRRCVVLFDAGIDQLGAPRIAHLAVLILLARRAEEQRATLEWGVLQDSGVYLHPGLTTVSVLDLLRARCVRSVSPADTHRWATHLQGLRPSETWLVGAEPLGREALSLRASAITASDVLEPGSPQRILVRAWVPQVDRIREAVLEIPAGRLAAKLLRDPFESAVASRLVTDTRINVQSTMVFAPNARRLYVRGAQSTLIAFHVPNSPRATPGPPVAFAPPDGQMLIAVGNSRNRTVALSQCDQELFLHVLSKRGATMAHTQRFAPSSGYSLPVHGTNILRPLGVLEHNRYCFIDDQGDLVELVNDEILLREHASAIGSKAGHAYLAWVTLHSGIPRVMWARTNSWGSTEVSQATMPEDMPPICGLHSFRFGSDLSEVFAYATSPRDWVIADLRKCVLVRVPDHLAVSGVVVRGPSRQVGLIVLDETRTRIEFFRNGSTETLVTTGAPVTGIEVSGTGSEVAFVTSAGEVGVYSCLARAVVARTAGGMAP